RRGGDVAVAKADAAGAGREEAADEVEESGLAGAVGADHRVQIAGLDLEGYAIDGDQAAEGAHDIVDLEQAHACLVGRRMPSTPLVKNTTTSTKKMPISDIQLSVRLESFSCSTTKIAAPNNGPQNELLPPSTAMMTKSPDCCQWNARGSTKLHR